MVPLATGIKPVQKPPLIWEGREQRHTPEAPGLPNRSEGGDQLEGLWSGETRAGTPSTWAGE